MPPSHHQSMVIDIEFDKKGIVESSGFSLAEKFDILVGLGVRDRLKDRPVLYRNWFIWEK